VLDEITIRGRRKALDEMPRALSRAFGVTIERIKRQNAVLSKKAMDVLKWVFLAREPLTIEEIRHALAVEPGDRNLDWDNFIDGKVLLESCLGLVVIDEPTSQNPIIRLVHKSLQDYLQIEHNQGRLFIDGHHDIAYVCLAYILCVNSHDLETIKPNLQDFFIKHALLDYAAQSWFHHMNMASSTNTVDLSAAEQIFTTLILEEINSNPLSEVLLRSSIITRTGWDYGYAVYSRHYTDPVTAVRHVDLAKYFDDPRPSRKSTPVLHLIAYTGFERVFRHVFQPMGADINAKDSLGQTPLHIAVKNGHVEIVKFLLEQDTVELNSVDLLGQTPLFHATKLGDLEIVKLLLKEDEVDVNLGDAYGETPLSYVIIRLTPMEPINLFGETFSETSANGWRLQLGSQSGYDKSARKMSIFKLLLETDGVTTPR
jgi:hypothetical protein